MALDLSIIGWPLAAGLLVLATHVPLGRRVLQRGIIFIDLAVAQIAGLGVVGAQLLHVPEHGLVVQLIALAAALLGSLLLYWCERRWPQVQEAIIGSAFILAATGAMLLLAHHPHGAQQVEALLSGQILWVSSAQLPAIALIYAVVLLLWFSPWWRGGALKFYLLFAVAVTVSVQVIGVYLVFASLIIPALATRTMSAGALAAGYSIGAAGYMLGLAGSSWWDLPGGPMIVWMLALCALVFAAVRGLARGAPGA